MAIRHFATSPLCHTLPFCGIKSPLFPFLGNSTEKKTSPSFSLFLFDNFPILKADSFCSPPPGGANIQSLNLRDFSNSFSLPEAPSVRAERFTNHSSCGTPQKNLNSVFVKETQEEKATFRSDIQNGNSGSCFFFCLDFFIFSLAFAFISSNLCF